MSVCVCVCVYVAFWPVDATKVGLMSNKLALNDATVRIINPITNTHTDTHGWAPFIKRPS
jgi:hypothetical protein